MANFNDICNFIEGTANLIRDKFKRGDYQDVILPLTVLRRIDCVLEPTKDQVLESYNKYKNKLNKTALDKKLKQAAEAPFYNFSKFTFPRLLNEPQNIQENLFEYIHSFSPNMQDVLNNFQFKGTIQALHKHRLLYKVVKRFCSSKIDLHPNNLKNSSMGDIFEELIRRFNEALDENPGEHFTPREVVHLMAELAISPDKDRFEEGKIIHIYDPCCGTGGMLTETEERIKNINEDVDIWLFGQEVNPETYAVCKADMFMKLKEERAADNIADDSTFSNDAFSDRTFDYMLANPPYGKDWKSDKDEIMEEYKRGYGGRFGAGLPSISDGQLLFIQNMLSKMQDKKKGGSRIAVISNASPLFTADPNFRDSKNECDIRRWILENDWLEALIRLPEQMFYNTPITTYIWVLSNRKKEERKGKVQIIDASGEEFWTLLPKNKGKKRREITEEQIQEILKIYNDIEENDFSQIHDMKEFGYRKVRIERPLRENYKATPERIDKIWEERAFKNLTKKKNGKEKQKAIINSLRNMNEVFYSSREEYEKELNNVLEKENLKLKKSIINNIFSALGKKDTEAEIVRNKKGNPESDSDLTDYEYVPLDKNVQEYFEEEVKPYVKDAWINEDMKDEKDGKLGKIGYEINFNRYFYEYEPPRPLEEIENDIEKVEGEILEMIKEVTD